MNSSHFEKRFRESIPNISTHSGKTFVPTLGADAIALHNFVNIVGEIDELPASKQALYNYQRISKTMIKGLNGCTAENDRPKS